MPWFSTDDYEAFKRLLPTRHWHASFQTWQAGAEQLRQEIETSAQTRVIPVPVYSHAFADWCREQQRDIDCSSLREYTMVLTHDLTAA